VRTYHHHVEERTVDPDSSKGKESASSNGSSSDEPLPRPAVKELLLCLRPIRDGEKKADEKDRFIVHKVTDDSRTGEGDTASRNSSSSNTDPSQAPPEPLKKRKPAPSDDTIESPKRRRTSESAEDVAGALVMMSTKD